MPLKVWNGSAFTMAGQVNVWNGSSWVQTKAAKVWNGSAWVQFHPGVELQEYGTGIDLFWLSPFNDAFVGLLLNSNGTASYFYGDNQTPQTNFLTYSWLLTGANTDYYAFMDTPSGGSFDVGSSAVNAALQLNNSRSWVLSQPSLGQNSVTSTLRIQTASGVDIVSQPVIMTAEVL